MAHTPGPWRLETVKTQVGVCHKIGELGSSTKLNHACLYDDCYSDKLRDLQLLADAHLIVAAPELLEACKSILAHLESGALVRNTSKDHESDWAIKQIPLLRDLAALGEAISKAEGK